MTLERAVGSYPADEGFIALTVADYHAPAPI